MKRGDALEALRDGLVASIQRQAIEAREAAMQAKFYEEFGDPELWDAHKKIHSKKLEFVLKSTDLKNAVTRLVESGVNVEGMSVAEVLAGYEGEPEDEIEWKPTGFGGQSGTRTGRTIKVKKNDVPEEVLGLRFVVGG